MKRLAIILLALISAAVLYETVFRAVTLRYRLTLEVEVDGQPTIGSGVIQVSYFPTIRILGATATYETIVIGEAVTIDLGRPELLLVLLVHGKNLRSDQEDIIPNLFGAVSGGFGPEQFDKIRAVSGRRSVPVDFLPAMAWLKNSRDPSSAVLFDGDVSDPTRPGLKLKMAQIDIVPHGIWPLSILGITGTPITRAIQEKLPWVDHEESRKVFYGALYDSGFRPGGAIETKSLLMRGR